MERRDKALVGLLSLPFVALALAAALWTRVSDPAVIMAIGAALCLSVGLQLELFRRIRRQLREAPSPAFAADLNRVIETRRSVRRFTDEPVATRDLRKMLDAARMAPSGGNRQPWKFIVLENREMIGRMEATIRKGIEEMARTWTTAGKDSEKSIANTVRTWKRTTLCSARAPITVAVLVEDIPGLYDESHVRHLMDVKGLDRAGAKRRMGLVELASVSAAIENLLLAAHSLGYGACWLRAPYFAGPELEDLLQVRPPWELAALIPIGRPDPKHPPHLPRKKTLEEIASFV